MANISQHEAAELWEIARDHFTTGAKFHFLCQHVHDTQLKATIEQHARRMQQVGQQVTGLIGQTGANQGTTMGTGGLSAQGDFQTQQFGQFQSAPSYGQTNSGSLGTSGQSMQGTHTGIQSTDILVASECLKECKRMAVAAVWGATEASQPARNILYQLAGEHLQMADQHYRWLERQGMYASPKADQQTIGQYTQVLGQISQAGQFVSQQFTSQAHQFGGQTHQFGTQTSQFAGQTQPYGSHSYQYGGPSQQYGGYQHHAQSTQTGLSQSGTGGFGQQYGQQQYSQ